MKQALGFFLVQDSLGNLYCKSRKMFCIIYKVKWYLYHIVLALLIPWKIELNIN